jgi:hypothetical protein
MKAGAPLGIISLQYATAIEPDIGAGPGKFIINTPDRVWHLDAGTEKERDKWITGLREAKEIYELVKNKIREQTISTYGSDLNEVTTVLYKSFSFTFPQMLAFSFQMSVIDLLHIITEKRRDFGTLYFPLCLGG